MATARDVTEEKLQAEALRESEERFRPSDTHAPIGIARERCRREHFFCEQQMVRIDRCDTRRNYGTRWKTFIHPDDLEGVIEAWQSSLQAGKDMPPYEFRFLHRNGDIRWASSSVSMLKRSDGRVVGQIASVQDVTDRKQMEIALREAEERFRYWHCRLPSGFI